MLQEGQKFGDKERYELVRLLGRGGFSEVWLANDDWTHIQVAIKVYAPGTGLDEAGIAIFTQEFSMVFDMNHTNLLKPTYFDSWERQPYLIMPLCQNGSAFKYVAGKERITEEQCWNMLHDVAAGLAYLHAKNPPLIHQDIKPDNILISDEGLYMITDFGISARVRSTIRNGMAQEQSGGTLAYMGPERFSSRPRPIMDSDIWSLGAMMYELICGLPPFGNNGGLMQKKGAEIPIIEDEHITQELKDIIYACLNEDPARRPWASTIEELTYKHLHGMDLSPIGGTQQPMAQSQLELQQQVWTSAPSQQEQQENMQQAVPLQQDALQNMVQSFQNTAQPMQQSNGLPVKKGIDKKRIGMIAGGVAVVLIGLVVLLLGGGNDTGESKVEAVAEVAVPQVNLDSIAQAKVLAAKEIARQAAAYKEQYSEELLDSAHGLVEEYYERIIDVCEDYKAEASYVQGAQLKNASLQTTLDIMKQDAERELLTIYQQLAGRGKEFEEIGSTELAVFFNTRAAAIKRYIEPLLPKE